MAINPQILAKIFGGTPQGMGQEQAGQIGTNSLMAFGANMLANSRTNSGSAPSFGQALGSGVQAGMQANQQGVQNAQRAQMREMQMQQMQGQLDEQARIKKQRDNMLRLIGGGQNYGGQGFAGQANTEAAPSALQNLTPQARQVLMSMSPEMQQQALYQHSGIAPQQQTLPAEEVEALGLPEGSLVQRDPVTGGVKILREGWDEDAFRQQQEIQFGYQNQLAQNKAALTASASTSAADQKIQRLMTADPSMTYSTAVALADGRYVTSRDPVSGQAQIIDRATGQLVGGTNDQAATTVESTSNDNQQVMIDPNLDFSAGTGSDAAISQLWNTGLDALGLSGTGLYNEDSERAVQQLGNLQTQTMVTLSQEVAGRPSNMLLEQFRNTTVEPASILNGDRKSYERLKSSKALIDQKKQMVQDVVSNPDQYRPAEVSQARQNLQALNMLGQQYDAVIQQFGRGNRDQQSQGSTVPGQQGTPRVSQDQGSGSIPTIRITTPRGGDGSESESIDDLVNRYGG